MQELTAALDAHRATLDLGPRRLASRRGRARADFVVEHGEHGLRALGGRREAARLLATQPPGDDIPALVAALEQVAGVGNAGGVARTAPARAIMEP
jgi:LAO/AO transport system kinase